MRTTIDVAGRIVVPKSLREELGFTPGSELEVEAVDGRLEIAFPSRVRVQETADGPLFVADGAEQLTDDDVRQLIERGRR
jgi:AbrB family looped-hinge helix DNA binding protein